LSLIVLIYDAKDVQIMSATKKIRVLLADDHAILRQGLRALFEQEPDIVVVADVGNGRDAVQKALDLQPDVVVMDLSMPDLNGIDATLQIKGDLFRAKILCLTVHRETSLVSAMLTAGASGYVLKSSARSELIGAVRSVARGETYLSAPIAADIVEHHVRGKGTGNAGVFMDLTSRQREVLQLIAEGHNTKEIAGRLHIGPKTVLAHRETLMQKLGAHSTVDLARFALREGISEL
jgi:DNA-binding NarL/FixJ family response regulator